RQARHHRIRARGLRPARQERRHGHYERSHPSRARRRLQPRAADLGQSPLARPSVLSPPRLRAEPRRVQERLVSVPNALVLNPPAERASIEALAEYSLPQDYLDFLGQHNGGCGFLGNGAYADLWRAEDLIQRNRGYGVFEDAPDAFIFGSDGGGEG